KTIRPFNSLHVSEFKINSNEELFILGRFQGSLDIDPDPNKTVLLNTGNLSQIFFVKWSGSGNLIFGDQIGGATNSDYPTGLDILEPNRLFISGGFFNTTDLAPGPTT